MGTVDMSRTNAAIRLLHAHNIITQNLSLLCMHVMMCKLDILVAGLPVSCFVHFAKPLHTEALYTSPTGFSLIKAKRRSDFFLFLFFSFCFFSFCFFSFLFFSFLFFSFLFFCFLFFSFLFFSFLFFSFLFFSFLFFSFLFFSFLLQSQAVPLPLHRFGPDAKVSCTTGIAGGGRLDTLHACWDPSHRPP